MTAREAAAEVRVIFDSEAIRAYGGHGRGFHANEEMARTRGYPGLVSWGSLTLLPFWELMERIAGPSWQTGGSLSVRLSKPVLAGDEVIYTAHLQDNDASPPGQRTFKLLATTARNGVVAKGQATIGSAGGGT